LLERFVMIRVSHQMPAEKKALALSLVDNHRRGGKCGDGDRGAAARLLLPLEK
jgi:hypothetical protein